MAAETLKVRTVRSTTVREFISAGKLPELEYGLLKRNGDKLRWKTEDKAVLLDMSIDTLWAHQGSFGVEVEVRALCHSHSVTADYLKLAERFNMKHTVLVLGDLGSTQAAWAELIQVAVYLHTHEFNVIFIEVPSFASDPQRWLKYGPDLIRGVLRHMSIIHLSVLARGVGGAVFLQALANGPELFGKTHVVYNLDLPNSKQAQLPVFDIEELLRIRELQLWFCYQDEEGVDDRMVDGPPNKCYDSMTKAQVRLEGERRRGQREQEFDEVLVTESLNRNPANEHVKHLAIGRNNLFVFSDKFLAATARFLELPPSARQESLVGGLPSVGIDETIDLKDNELPAMRSLRIGPEREARAAVKAHNRLRLKTVDEAVACLLETVCLPALMGGENALAVEDGGRSYSHMVLDSDSDISSAVTGSKIGSKSLPGASDIENRRNSKDGRRESGLQMSGLSMMNRRQSSHGHPGSKDAARRQSSHTIPGSAPGSKDAPRRQSSHSVPAGQGGSKERALARRSIKEDVGGLLGSVSLASLTDPRVGSKEDAGGNAARRASVGSKEAASRVGSKASVATSRGSKDSATRNSMRKSSIVLQRRPSKEQEAMEKDASVARYKNERTALLDKWMGLDADNDPAKGKVKRRLTEAILDANAIREAAAGVAAAAAVDARAAAADGPSAEGAAGEVAAPEEVAAAAGAALTEGAGTSAPGEAAADASLAEPAAIDAPREG